MTHLCTRDASFALARLREADVPGLREVAGYREVSQVVAVRRELPRPWLSLVWEFGTPVEHLTSGPPCRLTGGFVAGLHFRPGVTRVTRGQQGVCISLDPLWAPAVLGASPGELTDAVIALDDLVSRDDRSMAARLGDLSDWGERLSLARQWVLQRVARAAPPPLLVVAMLERIHASGGTVRLKDLARASGYSAKHLICSFRAHVGVSPKQFARIVRFRRAQYLLALNREAVAAVALRAGFADQAHLTRELQALGAGTPRAEQVHGLAACQELRTAPPG